MNISITLDHQQAIAYSASPNYVVEQAGKPVHILATGKMPVPQLINK
ncbi:hypothetical protein QUB33_26290 [Microcoleus sp. B3-A4]